jgi:hypothetical protein
LVSLAIPSWAVKAPNILFTNILYLYNMAKIKQVKDAKPSKEASKTFHDIMGASVKGNPKPKEKKKGK